MYHDDCVPICYTLFFIFCDVKICGFCDNKNVAQNLIRPASRVFWVELSCLCYLWVGTGKSRLDINLSLLNCRLVDPLCRLWWLLHRLVVSSFHANVKQGAFSRGTTELQTEIYTLDERAKQERRLGSKYHARLGLHWYTAIFLPSSALRDFCKVARTCIACI